MDVLVQGQKIRLSLKEQLMLFFGLVNLLALYQNSWRYAHPYPMKLLIFLLAYEDIWHQVAPYNTIVGIENLYWKLYLI